MTPEENRSKMFAPKVNQIDVYTIEDRLRKDKTKEGKEVWNYIKKLKEALTRQQELTAKAIGKLREQSENGRVAELEKEVLEYSRNLKNATEGAIELSKNVYQLEKKLVEAGQKIIKLEQEKKELETKVLAASIKKH